MSPKVPTPNKNFLLESTMDPWIKRNISYINGVPYVAYGFWFGDKMLGERERVYKQLKAYIGPPFYLITVTNISDFESREHPFNPAVKYTFKHNNFSFYFYSRSLEKKTTHESIIRLIDVVLNM